MPKTAPTHVLEAEIKAGLDTRIASLQKEIATYGYNLHMGSEDEFYLYGRDAHQFKAKHEGELKTRFRGVVDRVYEEAKPLLLKGTGIRLRVPGVHKWEITTRHAARDGSGVSGAEQVAAINDIRHYIAGKQKEWGVVVDYSARPIPDIQQAVKDGNFGLTDRAVLASLKEQVRSPSYDKSCRDHVTEVVFNMAYRFLADHHVNRAGQSEAAYLKKIDEAIKPGASVDFLGLSRRELKEFREAIHNKRQELTGTLAAHRTAILAARSFDELCSSGVIVSKDVPGSGVDVNVSLWKNGENAMIDPATGKVSRLFDCITDAAIKITGRDTGSLLPSTQSYDMLTYLRMGQSRLAASAIAAVTQSKADGGNLKCSPPSMDEAPRRQFRGHDLRSGFSARIERREGEPGGGVGYDNELAQRHYIFTTLLAIRDGLAMFASKEQGPLCKPQAFTKSHAEALERFKKSELLRRAYGEKLHRVVATHAEKVIAEKAVRVVGSKSQRSEVPFAEQPAAKKGRAL